MQLFYPIGLFAAAAIMVPLLIHLWKIKKGKTLRIGSIALLGHSAQQSSRSLMFSEWILLLLRCLLLILLAVLLAQPYLEKFATGKVKGWILVQKESFPDVYLKNRLTIDSLLQSGFSLHDFKAGFPALSLNDTVQENRSHQPFADYFSLVKQVNALVHSRTQVHLFHNPKLSALSEALPVLNYRLKIYDIARTDTVSSWTSQWHGKSFVARSTPSQTAYTWQAAPKGVLTVLIHAPLFAQDQVYLEAAIASISDYSERQIVVSKWDKDKFLRIKPDIVFWLSEQPVDSSLMSSWKKGAQLFSYAKGKLQNRRSSFLFDAAASEVSSAIILNKRIIANNEGYNVWTDGYGEAILTLKQKKELNHFELFTRFDPQWSDFVWNEKFVEAMMPVLFDKMDEDADFGFENHEDDQRKPVLPVLKMDDKQLAAPKKLSTPEPVSLWFWLAAMMVFSAERILSVFLKPKVTVDE